MLVDLAKHIVFDVCLQYAEISGQVGKPTFLQLPPSPSRFGGQLYVISADVCVFAPNMDTQRVNISRVRFLHVWAILGCPFGVALGALRQLGASGLQSPLGMYIYIYII